MSSLMKAFLVFLGIAACVLVVAAIEQLANSYDHQHVLLFENPSLLFEDEVAVQDHEDNCYERYPDPDICDTPTITEKKLEDYSTSFTLLYFFLSIGFVYTIYSTLNPSSHYLWGKKDRDAIDALFDSLVVVFGLWFLLAGINTFIPGFPYWIMMFILAMIPLYLVVKLYEKIAKKTGNK